MLLKKHANKLGDLLHKDPHHKVRFYPNLRLSLSHEKEVLHDHHVVHFVVETVVLVLLELLVLHLFLIYFLSFLVNNSPADPCLSWCLLRHRL